MSDPRDFYFRLPARQRPEYASFRQEYHPAYKWLSKRRARSRKRDVLEVVDTIVIHATAGYATQHAIDTWRKKPASAHWIIPDEDEPQHGEFVWSTVEESKAAYHVGNVDYEGHIGAGPNVNNRSLGIEIVNTQDAQAYRDPYSPWQIEAAARIVLYAWWKYPNLKHVISHARLDPGRRSDPGGNFPWDKFMNLVLSHEPIEEPNPLIFAEYFPPEPVEFSGNCCEP